MSLFLVRMVASASGTARDLMATDVNAPQISRAGTVKVRYFNIL